MGVSVRFDGDSKALVDSQDKVARSAHEITEEYKKIAREGKEVERLVAQSMSAGERATQKYNREVDLLNRHLKSGTITQKEYTQAVARSKAEFDNATRSQSSLIQGISQLAAGVGSFVSLTGAVSLFKTVMAEVRQEAEGAARALESQVSSLGALGQLGVGGLQGQAQGLRAAGAVGSQDEANRLLFKLVSGGLLQDVGTFRQLGEARLVENLEGLAEAVSKFQTALGRQETGTTEAIISKTLAAAKVSPNEAAAVITAAARSGASARAAKFGDEETLAATAILSSVFGAEIAGTRADALFRTLDKQGLALGNLADSIKAIVAAPGGERAALEGNEEAIQALRTLAARMDEFIALEREVQQANTGDRLRAALAANAAVPAIAAATSLRGATGTVETLLEGIGVGETIRDAMDKRLEELDIIHGKGRAVRAIGRGLGAINRFFGGDPVLEGDLQRLAGEAQLTQDPRDDEIVRQLIELNKQLRENTSRQESDKKVSVPSVPTN